MGKTLRYVKDFDFSAKPCNYSCGGSAQRKYATGGNVQSSSTPVKKAFGGEMVGKAGRKLREAIEKSPRPYKSDIAKESESNQPRLQMPQAQPAGMFGGTAGAAQQPPPNAALSNIKNQMVKAPVGMMGGAGGFKKGGKVKKYATGGDVKKADSATPGVTKAKQSNTKVDSRAAAIDRANASLREIFDIQKKYGMPGGDGEFEPISGGTRSNLSTSVAMNKARGGVAKVGKVMSEFKAGKLHSGSKSGPEVKNRKQAIAIALSESRKGKSRA